jgi:hypothetical protein
MTKTPSSQSAQENPMGAQYPHTLSRTAEVPTVVVRLGGGLGNQLFQYAFGRRMALANEAKLVLDASGYRIVRDPDPRLGIRALGLAQFHITGTLITQTNPALGSVSPLPDRPWIKRKYLKWGRKLMALLQQRQPYYLRHVVAEPETQHFTFDPKLYSRAIRGTVVFEGYWQTEKYFLEVESLLRRELTVRDDLEGENAAIASRITATNSVAVHVRHGDNASGVETALGTLPRSYYDRAIQGVRNEVPNPRFFVFSDDVDWARALFGQLTTAEIVSHNGDARNYEDLRLMSMCKHHILANSTFSWWGAWLGKNAAQIVYAPRRYWQNIDRANPDLYPERWRLI